MAPPASYRPPACKPVQPRPREPAGYRQMNFCEVATRYIVKVTMFWTEDAVSAAHIPGLVSKATELLGKHNIGLDVYSGTDDQKLVIKYKGAVQIDSDDLADIGKVRALANDLFHPDSHRDRLVVIVCPFRLATPKQICNTTGITLGGGRFKNAAGTVHIGDSDWLRFVLINSEVSAPDAATLAHEIGHACGFSDDQSTLPADVEKDVVNIMRWQGTMERRGLTQMQVMEMTTPWNYFVRQP
ncbi:MAG: hypothetical protein ACJ8FY_29040 [Gemmataceae bacterium]